MLFELEEGEIPPYSDLSRGLGQALRHIQQLEAALHSEHQSWLAAKAANQPNLKLAQFLAVVARW